MNKIDTTFLHENGPVLTQPFTDVDVVRAIAKMSCLTTVEIAQLIGASELEFPTYNTGVKDKAVKPLKLSTPTQFVLSQLYGIIRELYHRDLNMSIRTWLFSGDETPYSMLRNDKWVRVWQKATRHLYRIYPDYSMQFSATTWSSSQYSSTFNDNYALLDRDPSGEGLNKPKGDRWDGDPIELFDPTEIREWKKTDGEMAYLIFDMFGRDVQNVASLLHIDGDTLEAWVEDQIIIPPEKRELMQMLYSYAREAMHRKLPYDFVNYLYDGKIDNEQIHMLIEKGQWNKLWQDLLKKETLLAPRISPTDKDVWEMHAIVAPSCIGVDFFEIFKDLELSNGLAITKYADGHLGPLAQD